jgi:amidophosphoribosyltransferase
MAGEIQEKCAVAGVTFSPEAQELALKGDIAAAPLVYEILYATQHRGPEASGIAATAADGTVNYRRKSGMVRDVYTDKSMRKLTGAVAIGQNKYTTDGDPKKHLQPVVDHDVALGHNGNLPVTEKLSDHLESKNISTAALNDSEMMGYTIASEVHDGNDFEDAIIKSYPLFRGAFSVVASHHGKMVAFRDKAGIRPLAIGKFADGYAVSSETCGLDIINADFVREVRPGEMVVFDQDGSIRSHQIEEGEEKLDMFEMVYFARHDSYLYGKRVKIVRKEFGRQLAMQHEPKYGETEDIIVVPVPDTSIPAAEGYAKYHGLDITEAIIKNRYIGRTFLAPSQQLRLHGLRRKHNLITEDVKEKHVIFVDDSIVRFNTAPVISQMAIDAGAKTVSFLVSSPPVRYPDFYGIDTPEQRELSAAVMTIEQMRKKANLDYLGYLSLSRMVEATGLPESKFTLSAFNGKYPIGIGDRKNELFKPISSEYLD